MQLSVLSISTLRPQLKDRENCRYLNDLVVATWRTILQKTLRVVFVENHERELKHVQTGWNRIVQMKTMESKKKQNHNETHSKFKWLCNCFFCFLVFLFATKHNPISACIVSRWKASRIRQVEYIIAANALPKRTGSSGIDLMRRLLRGNIEAILGCIPLSPKICPIHKIRFLKGPYTFLKPTPVMLDKMQTLYLLFDADLQESILLSWTNYVIWPSHIEISLLRSFEIYPNALFQILQNSKFIANSMWSKLYSQKSSLRM